jgi:phosphomannomutase
MSKLMVSISGIRGVFGETITPLSVLTYAANFGLFCGRGTIVIGRDSRTTGQSMFNAIAAGLTGVGCDVIDLGIVPTPTVLLAVKDHQAAGGIAITASHNPPEWNALKLISSNGMFLFPEEAEEYFSRMDKQIVWSDWQTSGKVIPDNKAIDRHIAKILSLSYLDIASIRKKRYKVVIDSVNGAGGLISPKLLAELGCEVIEINSQPTGIFSHPAEPLNVNLGQLEKAVRDFKADIGFATDPDVDRLSIVSDTGTCIGEEFTVALAELFVLSRQKSDIVVNLSSSMLSDYIAGQFGVKVHRTRIGEIYVSKKMQEIKSAIGGEGNGGVICPEVNYSRDALAGMALILGLLTDRCEKITGIVLALPRYFVCKGKMETEPDKIDKVLNKALNLFSGLDIDRQDGVKAIGEDFWIHVRKSGTEPIIRVYVESGSQEKSDRLCKSIMKDLL